jgi:hypothetical protein
MRLTSLAQVEQHTQALIEHTKTQCGSKAPVYGSMRRTQTEHLSACRLISRSGSRGGRDRVSTIVMECLEHDQVVDPRDPPRTDTPVSFDLFGG